jgi:hypothetical protein
LGGLVGKIDLIQETYSPLYREPLISDANNSSL